MSLRGKQSGARFGEQETPPLDLSGGESHHGLLSRLQNQNSALEKLRLALDTEDEVRDLPHSPHLLDGAAG